MINTVNNGRKIEEFRLQASSKLKTLFWPELNNTAIFTNLRK